MDRPLSSIWGLPIRLAAYVSNAAYNPIKYEIRGWGRLPRKRGPTLLVNNHLHLMEGQTLVSRLGLTQSSWRHPIFSITGRRMHEPGFMAQRIPWLRTLLRRFNASPLFLALGFVPLENQLRSREIVGLAWAIQERHGVLPLTDIFDESVSGRFAPGTTTADLYAAGNWNAAHGEVGLRALREPYRREVLERTRESVEKDMNDLEDLVRRGATVYITPEGHYSSDGRINRFRRAYEQLAPLATVYLVGVSYDPFVGKRLRMLFNIVRLEDRAYPREELARIRFVTVSQLIAEWLVHRDDTAFTAAAATDAIQRRRFSLPASLPIDPTFAKHPGRRVELALAGLVKMGILAKTKDGRYRLTGVRTDPNFSHVPDILAHQANFLEESIAGANLLTAKPPPAGE